MPPKPFSPWIFLLSVALTPLGAGAEEPFSHDDWGLVLERFVDARGFVDYQALSEDRRDLDRYLAALSTHSPKSSPQLFPSRDHRLAYWINAYNALVFSGVLDRGPEPESVWKGGLISGYKFFVARKFTLGGKRISLKKLEDDFIREGFEDPRIHAALNCASISCPRLPQVPFQPEALEAELDAAMEEFVAEDRNVRIDAAKKIVYLSKIFDWFEKDFLTFERQQGGKGRGLADYVNRYRAPETQIPENYKVRFLPYDKGINAS